MAVFSLVASISATVAWFAAQRSLSVRTGDFEVTVVGEADLLSVNLIKFDYNTTTWNVGSSQIEIVDYIDVSSGRVHVYDYDYTNHVFGRFENSVWKTVSAMNMYDPVAGVIRGNSLMDLNCNAIYEVSFNSPMGECYFELTSTTFDVGSGYDLLLSDCVDIDIFYEADLENAENYPSTDGKPNYYPSYMPANYDMSDEEEIYYKLSYLSSRMVSHSHFYGDPKQNSITIAHNKPVDFTSGAITFYINVNYSPSQADEYMTEIYGNEIRAKYDYGFNFLFGKSQFN